MDKYVDDYLYIYYSDKSYQVEAHLLHLSMTTKLQVRYVKAISSILKAISTIQLES